MEDLRIRRLVLNEVGVFEHLDLAFAEGPEEGKAEIHIFVGENGTGKTTLLEAMTIFHDWFGRIKNSKGEWERAQRRSRVYAKIDERNGNPLIQLILGQSVIKHAPGYGESYAHINELEEFFAGYYSPGYHDDPKFHSYNFFAYSGMRRLEQSYTEPFKSLDFDPIAEGLTFEKGAGSSSLFQWIANNTARSGLALQRKDTLDADNYMNQIRKIESAVSEIIGRRFEFVIHEKDLQVQIRLEGKSMSVGTLPDGYQSIIGWLADLLFRLDLMPEAGKENFTLFLDEIDIHLHPKAQRRILPVIQKLFPKAQIFLTTHSPFIVGSVDGAWVYKFKLDENGHSVLDGEPRLSEDARSYRSILEDVFDIRENFGMEAQSKLDEFYQLRQEVLRGSTDENWMTFNTLGMKLASQSPEMHSYVSLELRQAARILNRQLIH